MLLSLEVTKNICYYNQKICKYLSFDKIASKNDMNEGSTMGKYEKKSNGLFLLILILILITMFSSCTAIYYAFFRQSETTMVPDYMPVEQDKEVRVIQGEETAPKMEASEGGGGAVIIFTTEVTVHKSTGIIEFMYQNPGRSLAAVVLQLEIDDVVIAQSGSIQPGYALTTMDLFEGINLQEGGYHGLLRVSFYDTETNEKSVMDTEIQANITVVS